MKPSNLYSERIYKDHPIACWPLDDDLSYIELLNQTESDLMLWNLNNISSVSLTNSDDYILNFSSNSSSFIANIETPWFVDSNTFFDSNVSTAFFSATVNHLSHLIYKYEIGIVVDGVYEFSSFSFDYDYGIKKIMHTFEIPSNKNIYFFINFYCYSDISSGLKVSVSLGQDGENSATKKGVIPQTIDSVLQSLLKTPSSLKCSYLDAYSITPEYNGIYVHSLNSPFVKPAGIPIAYGSYQSLNILEAPNGNPSIIIPSAGFLNESGINNTYSLEFWMRCENLSGYPIRILGPVKSSDGVYLDGGFLSLKIGIYSKSYFIGKWYRPMLIHVKYTPKQVSLMINGETVISIDIDKNYLNFPSKDFDYLGVYGSSFVKPFEIDSISIYPYLIPPQMAKIHFVYGQGVEEKDFSNKKFVKKTVEIDYSVSEYAYGVIYPDTMKWRSGFSVSLDTSSTWIKPRSFDVPQIIVKKNGLNATAEQWQQKNLLQNEQDSGIAPYISINPLNYFDSSCLYYSDLNFTQERPFAIFGVFYSPLTPVANQQLMTFINKKTNQVFRIILDSNTLNYEYVSPNGTITLIDSFNVNDKEIFVAGIDIPKLSINEYSTIGNMFSSQGDVSLTIGSSTSSSFDGKMFVLHVCNEYFYNKDISQYSTNSVFDSSINGIQYISYIGNYSLIAKIENSSTYLDVGSSGYWEDVIPLSMFSKKISTPNGQQYDLDFIQINLDNPYKNISSDSAAAIASYNDLLGILKFENILTYLELSNSNYANYQELIDYATTQYKELNSFSKIKSYITLQPAINAGTIQYSNFSNIVALSSNGVVEIDAQNISNTKWEVYDNTVIIIPKSININDYFIGIHLEIISKESISKPLIIKRCELSSFVANDGIPTRVGTKFSENIYPFVEAV